MYVLHIPWKDPKRKALSKELPLPDTRGRGLRAVSAAARAQDATGLTSLPSRGAGHQSSPGSVPGIDSAGQTTPGTVDLTIEDALDDGLKYNLGLYFSERTTEQTRAARSRALSEMLPHIAGSLTEEVEKVNLKALGFTGALIPGIPRLDRTVQRVSICARPVRGTLSIFTISTICRAADQNVKAAKFSYRDARDTVVLAVGANYLLTIANESRVEAAQAELKTAQALYQLASDQETAGLAPNIDTLRAVCSCRRSSRRLIQAQNSLEKQRIALARVIGLPVTQQFRLVNRVPYHPLPETAVENAYCAGVADAS